MKKEPLNLKNNQGVYGIVWREKREGEIMSLHYNLKKGTLGGGEPCL